MTTDTETLAFLSALDREAHSDVLETLGIIGENALSPEETLRRVQLSIMLRREMRRRKLH